MLHNKGYKYVYYILSTDTPHMRYLYTNTIHSTVVYIYLTDLVKELHILIQLFPRKLWEMRVYIKVHLIYALIARLD